MTATIQSTCSVTFPTELGWFGVVLNPSGIERLHFGHKSKKEVLQKLQLSSVTPTDELPDWWSQAQNLLVAYAAGENVDLTEIPIAAGRQTPFQQRVVQQLRKVGYGQTVTYGELARRAGSAKAARAVGNQMACNKVPLLVPCHRVIGSGGHLGGFSAPQGLDMKVRLLEIEEFDTSQLKRTAN